MRDRVLLKILEADVTNRIRGRATAYARLGPGSAPPRVSVRRRNIRGYSVLLEFRIRAAESNDPQDIIAKFRRGSLHGPFQAEAAGEKAARLARMEFERLTAANSFFSSRADGLSVVRPLDFFPDLNGIVVEKAKGTDLGVLLKRSHPATTQLLSLCGDWLRMYHRSVNSASYCCRLVGPTVWAAELDKRHDRLRARGVPSALLDPLVASARILAAEACKEPVPYSIVHGDFKPRHIWSAGTAIQVLDFGNSSEAECYYDVAGLVAELTVLAAGPTPMSEARIDAYTSAFIRSYFPDARLPKAASYFIVEFLLKKWQHTIDRWNRHPALYRAQLALRQLGLAAAIDRRWIDPWFAERIRRVLRAAEA